MRSLTGIIHLHQEISQDTDLATQPLQLSATLASTCALLISYGLAASKPHDKTVQNRHSTWRMTSISAVQMRLKSLCHPIIPAALRAPQAILIQMMIYISQASNHLKQSGSDRFKSQVLDSIQILCSIGRASSTSIQLFQG